MGGNLLLNRLVNPYHMRLANMIANHAHMEVSHRNVANLVPTEATVLNATPSIPASVWVNQVIQKQVNPYIPMGPDYLSIV